MALTNALAPSLTYSLIDNNRKPGTVGIHLPVATPMADAVTFATTGRTMIMALTNAQLRGATYSYIMAEDAMVIPIPPESEIERKLVLVFGVAGGRGTVIQEIPSPIFGLEQANTDEVALDNPLVASYADHILNGTIGAGNGATNQYGMQLVELRRAYVAHRPRAPK